MGTGADMFGDLVYKQALQGVANPALDDQFFVYDSVQTGAIGRRSRTSTRASRATRDRRRGSGLWG